MHFSIPKASLVLEPGKDGYVSYDVHVNGLLHCSCRYRKLLELHEILKRQFGPAVATTFPPFPPKRLLPLSDQQLEQRRSQLEKYLQLVSQNSKVRQSEHFCKFLVDAQLETYEREVTLGNGEASSTSSSSSGGIPPPYLEVEAMNGTKTCLTIDQNDRGISTEHILRRVCEELKLPKSLHKYFRVVVVRRDPATGRLSLVRILEDYEAPWITLRRMDENLKVILRKR